MLRCILIICHFTGSSPSGQRESHTRSYLENREQPSGCCVVSGASTAGMQSGTRMSAQSSGHTSHSVSGYTVYPPGQDPQAGHPGPPGHSGGRSPNLVPHAQQHVHTISHAPAAMSGHSLHQQQPQPPSPLPHYLNLPATPHGSAGATTFTFQGMPATERRGCARRRCTWQLPAPAETAADTLSFAWCPLYDGSCSHESHEVFTSTLCSSSHQSHSISLAAPTVSDIFLHFQPPPLPLLHSFNGEFTSTTSCQRQTLQTSNVMRSPCVATTTTTIKVCDYFRTCMVHT